MADPNDDTDTADTAGQHQQPQQSPTRRGASPGLSAPTSGAAAAAGASAEASAVPRSPFAGYAFASAAQHAATHLSHAAPASASLSGEMLRQAWSQFLRSQVAHVSLAIVLAGFETSSTTQEAATAGGSTNRGAVAATATAAEPAAQAGKLCYIALTQCEMIVIDRAVVGAVSRSARSTPASHRHASRCAAESDSRRAYSASLCVPLSAPSLRCTAVSVLRASALRGDPSFLHCWTLTDAAERALPCVARAARGF